jgi:chemotaxis protein CheX
MNHERITESVRRASHEVFSTMLGVSLEDGEAYQDESMPGPSDGVLALVGLAGEWAGSGTFGCSAAMARRISGLMLMQEYDAVNEDVLDAIGEVSNMILGNVKTALEEEAGPMGLSIPTVVYGRNFTTRSVAKTEWSVVQFRCEGEVVEVRVCLVPGRQVSLMHRHSAVLSVGE